MRKVSLEIVAGCDRSSSSNATQSSPECMGMRSESSEGNPDGYIVRTEMRKLWRGRPRFHDPHRLGG